MSGRIQYEAELILLSLTGGGWLMMAYDILRILRMAVRHNAFWTGVEDFFYWLYAAGFTFMLLYDRMVSRFLFRCLKKAGKCFKMIGNRRKPGGNSASEEKERVRDR